MSATPLPAYPQKKDRQITTQLMASKNRKKKFITFKKLLYLISPFSYLHLLIEIIIAVAVAKKKKTTSFYMQSKNNTLMLCFCFFFFYYSNIKKSCFFACFIQICNNECSRKLKKPIVSLLFQSFNISIYFIASITTDNV